VKTLVVFYSRTGTTKKIGKALAELLRCDSEEHSKKSTRAYGLKAPRSNDCVLQGTSHERYDTMNQESEVPDAGRFALSLCYGKAHFG
jgi:flavodoxin